MPTAAPTSLLNLLATTPPAVALNLQTVQEAAVTEAEVAVLTDQLFYQRVGGQTLFFDRLGDLRAVLEKKKGRAADGLKDNKHAAGRARNNLTPSLKLDTQIAAATVLVNRALKEDDGVIPGDTHEFLWVLEEKGSDGSPTDSIPAQVLPLVSPTGPLGTASGVQLLSDLAADARNGSDFKEPASSALGALRLLTKLEKVTPEIIDALQEAAEIYLSSLRPLTAARLFFVAALAEGGELFEAATDRVPKNDSAREMSASSQEAMKEWDRKMVGQANLLDEAASALETCSLPGRPHKKYAPEIVALRKAAVRIMPRIVNGEYSKAIIGLLARAQESIAEFLEPAPGQDPSALAVLQSARYYLSAAANWNNFGEMKRGQTPLNEAVRFLQFLGIIPQI